MPPSLKPQKQFEVEQRREQIAQLYLAGSTQTAIARQLKIGIGTVNRDIQHIKGEWRALQVEAMDDAIAKHLAELDFIRQQVRIEYNTTKNVNVLVKLLDVQHRESRLLGLDAPVRTSVTSAPQTIEIVFRGDNEGDYQ